MAMIIYLASGYQGKASTKEQKASKMLVESVWWGINDSDVGEGLKMN